MSETGRGSGWAVWIGAGAVLAIAAGVIAAVSMLDFGSPSSDAPELSAPPSEQAAAPPSERAIPQRWRPPPTPGAPEAPHTKPAAPAEPPTPPAEPDPVQDLVERVRMQAQEVVDARRAPVVARCGPKAQYATVTLQLQFDADGRELARGGSGRRDQDASAEACIRQGLSDPILVEPPGRPITVNVVSGPVQPPGGSRLAQ